MKHLIAHCCRSFFLSASSTLVGSVTSSRNVICGALALLVVVFSPMIAQAFPANQCAADRYGSDLGCTANDVQITGMSVVGDTTSCVGGTSVSLDLQLTVNFAVPDRYDVGIFISNDGKDPQTLESNGGAATCTVSVLPVASPFLDLDGLDNKDLSTGDICGDGNGSIGGGSGSGIHYMPNVTVPCQTLDGAGGKLYIPFVVSWDNLASPSGESCASNLDPVPNTSSKCNSPTVTQGSVAVVVLPSITMNDGITTISSGASTAYQIVITNTTGASLSNIVLKDPAVSGITANSLTCVATGGASCPAVGTIGALQGAGITLPDMPAGGSLIFTLNATLTGNPSVVLTNKASVTVGGQTNAASDTNTIVGGIAILPPTLAKSGVGGATLTYNYEVYNFGAIPDNISLSLGSSQGWSGSLSEDSIIVPAGGSTSFTLTVDIPDGASLGTVDTTLLTAMSSNDPSLMASATAVTTVAAVLTLVPDNMGTAGAGSYVYYRHRVQSNVSSSTDVSLTPSFTSGTCDGWTSELFETDTRTLLITPVTLAANGGYKDLVLRVGIPFEAPFSSTCTAMLTAEGPSTSVSVTDITTVNNLILYEDPGYTLEQDTYPAGNNVYAKAFGLSNGIPYYYVWLDPADTVMRTSPITNYLGSLPDTYAIPNAGPLGTWTVQFWNNETDEIVKETNFYVGPDHLNASFSGGNQAINTDVVVNLALHDKLNHVVPFDAADNLVKGNPLDPEGPLMVTVTVSGSAEIVSTTLLSATISGQSVTGKLSSITGTATLTIRDAVPETVIITPVSYKNALYGSPGRDEPGAVTFVYVSAIDHIRIEHPGTGVTCSPAAVTVKACADAACSTLVTTPTTVTLSPATGWAASPITFTGSTTVSLSIPTAQTVSLGTSSVSPAPSGTSPHCFVGVTENCSLTFAAAGFIFDVPDHIADTTQTITLSAVRKDLTTQQCVPGFQDVTRDVAFWSEYLDPLSGTLAVRINNNSITTLATGTIQSLNFDNNGEVEIDVDYADVGQMNLNAFYQGSGDDAGLLMAGVDGFITRPHHFSVTVPGNPGASSAAGDVFTTAAENFSVEVSARNASGNVTPNFGREVVPESVLVSQSLVHPLGQHNPSLIGSFNSFGTNCDGDLVAGYACGQFSWDEVGIINLLTTVFDGNYLGSGNVVGTWSGNVGRFVPDRFSVSANTPLLGHGCVSGSYTYMGQEFSFLIDPILTFTALGATGSTLLNYGNNFWKYPALLSNRGYSHSGLEPMTVTFSNVGTSTLTGDVDYDGVGTVEINDDRLTYIKPVAAVIPFDTQIDLNVPTADLIDSDGVCYDPENDGICNSYTFSAILGGEQRYGRMLLQNAYGPELLALTMPLTVEYFTVGGYFDVNIDDSCTAVTTANHLELSLDGSGWESGDVAMTLGGGSTSATFDLSAISSGDAGLSFSAPGDGNVGSIEVRSSVGTNYPWLLFDWDDNGTVDETRGRLTFGIYKGNQRLIYMRESIW